LPKGTKGGDRQPDKLIMDLRAPQPSNYQKKRGILVMLLFLQERFTSHVMCGTSPRRHGLGPLHQYRLELLSQVIRVTAPAVCMVAHWVQGYMLKHRSIEHPVVTVT
jgi:hypothetical protein